MNNFTFKENLIYVCQAFNIPYSYQYDVEQLVDIVVQHRNKIDWLYLSANYFQNMCIEFIKLVEYELLWSVPQICKNLTEEHINHFSRRIDWHNVFWYKDHISDEFFDKYYGTLNDYHTKLRIVATVLEHHLWVKIIKENKISMECVTKYNNMGEIPTSVWEEIYQ